RRLEARDGRVLPVIRPPHAAVRRDVEPEPEAVLPEPPGVEEIPVAGLRGERLQLARAEAGAEIDQVVPQEVPSVLLDVGSERVLGAAVGVVEPGRKDPEPAQAAAELVRY